MHLFRWLAVSLRVPRRKKEQLSNQVKHVENFSVELPATCLVI